MINITNKVDCCGCTACESICGHSAIEFIEDSEGFLYPKVDTDKCVNCGLCDKVCPLIKRKVAIPKPKNEGYYAVRIRDKETLQNSSSGGTFSAVSEYILSQGGVVIGASYAEDMSVEHIIIDSNKDLQKLRGSKYSQSNLKAIFRKTRKLLNEGRLVLFSGTPCQVDGLKQFLIKDYSNLITIDIVCHAVPSPKLFREYISLINEKYLNKVVWLNMRDKADHGWSHRFSYKYIFENGKTVIDPNKVVPWSRLFFSKLIDRPSCHSCLYTNYSRPGDITLADLWDDRGLRPDIKSKEGTSLFIANTPKGLDILSKINDVVDKWQITKDESWQPCLQTPTTANPKREEFWNYYSKKGFLKSYKRYFEDSNYVKLKKLIKKIIRR